MIFVSLLNILPFLLLLALLIHSRGHYFSSEERHIFSPIVLGGLSMIISFGGIVLALISVKSMAFIPFGLFGGLFPWSDAVSYYDSAQRLLEFGTLGDWGARRPFFSIFLALYMGIFEQNLQLVTAFIAGTVALSISLLGMTIANYVGKFEASWTVICLVSTYFLQTGTGLVSENLGLTFGALSLALFLIGINRNLNTYLFLGGLLFSASQCARIGPVFCIPALILWYVFREPKKLRIVIWLVLGMIIPVGLNYLATKNLSSGGQVPFSNFAYSLYGLAHGGKGWFAAKEATASISALTDATRSKLIWELATTHIWQQPSDFIRGLLKSLYMAIVTPEFGDMLAPGLNIIVYFSCLVMFLQVKLWLRSPIFQLLIFILLGTFLSSPFLYDGGSRVFVAVHPYIAVISGIGLKYVCCSSDKDFKDMSSQYPGCRGDILVFLVSVVLFSLIPISIFEYSGMRESKPFGTVEDCKEGELKSVAYISTQSIVHIVPDENLASSFSPDVRTSDWSRNMNFYSTWSKTGGPVFSSMLAGKSIYGSLDVVSKDFRWLIFGESIPNLSGYYSLCLSPRKSDALGQNVRFYSPIK